VSTHWGQDKRWADQFLPQMKRICGEHLIGEAPAMEDAQHNTDLIVLTLAPVRIACRVRKASYVARYRNEFTIRAGRPSGTKTELTKIVEGWGDYLLYGFGDDATHLMSHWTLISLVAFRRYLMLHLAQHAGEMPGVKYGNHDGSSHFRVFNLMDIASTTPDIVFASSWNASLARPRAA
jgi:hypothetical protein